MGRKRIIDTDELLFDEELYGAVGKDGLWLYVRLWALAEDFGGYEAKYGNISLKTGVLKLKTSQVKEIIEKLIKLGKIVTYEINGKKYHWIKNLLKHQRLNNPAIPTLPLPPWVSCEIRQYKSGKKYASYEIDWDLYYSSTGSLPVDDQQLPGALETETETKRNETETRKDIVDPPARPSSDSDENSPLKSGLIFSVQDLAKLWNKKSPPELSRVNLPFKRPPKDMQKIRDAVKRNPDMSWWEQVISAIYNSPFLRGINDRGWKASLDFVVRKAEEILDGKYEGSKKQTPAGLQGLWDYAERRIK